MGNKKSKPNMPDELREKVLKLFSMIDVDGSKTIDKEETLKFWSSNFAKLNTKELFESVDKNDDGSIQEDEWLEFWAKVYQSGHSKEEIMHELDNLIEGKAWVKFENVDKMNLSKGKNKGKY